MAQRSFRALLAFLATAVVAPAALPAAAAPPPLRLCTTGAAEGFMTLDGERPEGLEVDILRSFADSVGRSLEISRYDDYRDVLADVHHGRCDIAGGMLTATPERARQVDFSRPYFPVRLVLVYRRGAPFANRSQLAGKRLVTVAGTTYDQVVSAIDGAEVVRVDTPRTMFETLARGDADAMACDSAVVLATLATYPNLEIGFSLSERQFYAFAVPPGSPLRAALDAHLETLFDSGAYRRLLVEHFGAEQASYILEDDPSAEPIPGG